MTDIPTPITDYINTAEASERAGVSQAHVIRLLQKGRISGVKKGRDWLILTPSLDAYIANRPKRGLKPGTKLGPRRKPAPGDSDAQNAQTL